jgi:hypothetical protein
MKLSDVAALSDRTRRFEELLAEVFRLEGFNVSTEVSGDSRKPAIGGWHFPGRRGKRMPKPLQFYAREKPG